MPTTFAAMRKIETWSPIASSMVCRKIGIRSSSAWTSERIPCMTSLGSPLVRIRNDSVNAASPASGRYKYRSSTCQSIMFRASFTTPMTSLGGE